MHNEFKALTFSDQVSHLIEECGEVLAAAGKLQRFGCFSVNPLLKPSDKHYQENNISWLKRELEDLKDVVNTLETTINKEF